jgi:hypothetical protein
LFLFQLSFLICILAFPLCEQNEFWMILVYLVLFIFREVSQFIGFRSTANLHSLRDYLDFWNLLDIFNIVFMIVYLCIAGDVVNNFEEEENRQGYNRWAASIYSLLVLVTWINLL